MKELVNQNSINELKKSRTLIIVSIIVSIVIAIGLMVPLFLFVTRTNRVLFTILLTAIASFEASFIVYICAVSLSPLNHYLKLSNLSLSGNKYQTKGEVVSINEKVTHYKGVAVYEIKVKDLEEENKEYIFYVEQNLAKEFSKEKTYSFITYQSLITAYEVL